MHRHQRVDEPAHRLAQGGVGGLEIREGGVTPSRRNHLGLQQRAQRRGRHERHIGVPGVVLVLVPIAGIGPGPGGVDLQHLGLVGQAGHDRMGRRELAEALGERHQLGRRKVLAGQEDDLVLDQGGPYSGHGVGWQRPTALDPAQHRADRAAQPLDLHGPVVRYRLQMSLHSSHTSGGTRPIRMSTAKILQPRQKASAASRKAATTSMARSTWAAPMAPKPK